MRSIALALFRLLAAISLVLMPLGMANASAPLAAPDSAAETSHCDGHEEPGNAPGGEDRHCAACIALPASDAPIAVAELLPQGPVSIAATGPLPSPAPEVATPPPKAG